MRIVSRLHCEPYHCCSQRAQIVSDEQQVHSEFSLSVVQPKVAVELGPCIRQVEEVRVGCAAGEATPHQEEEDRVEACQVLIF